MNTTPLYFISRCVRRSRRSRTERLRSFARRGHTVLLAALLPLGLLHAAHAQTLNTWIGGSGDWNTSAANWSANVIPNGSGSVFYAVVNSAGETLAHSSSTGTSGVDTIYSFSNFGTFNLTGGILAGSRAAKASTFINQTGGSVVINGGTLRNFTVSGVPLAFSGSQSNILDGDVFSSTLNLTNGGVALFVNGLNLTGTSVANIAADGYLLANNTETLTGTVNFTDGNGNNTLGIEGNSTLTLASTSLVHGIAGQVGIARITTGTGLLVNNGTISSDGGGTIALNPSGGTTNTGTLQAKTNSTLRLDTAVTNTRRRRPQHLRYQRHRGQRRRNHRRHRHRRGTHDIQQHVQQRAERRHL